MKIEYVTDERGRVRAIEVKYKKPNGEVQGFTTGIIGTVCNWNNLFFAVSILTATMLALMPTLEDTSTDLADVLEGAGHEEAAESINAANKAKLSYCIALIMVIVGLIYAAWGQK